MEGASDPLEKNTNLWPESATAPSLSLPRPWSELWANYRILM